MLLALFGIGWMKAVVSGARERGVFGASGGYAAGGAGSRLHMTRQPMCRAGRLGSIYPAVGIQGLAERVNVAFHRRCRCDTVPVSYIR